MLPALHGMPAHPSGRGAVGYDDLSEAEKRELRELVAAYLSGQV
jgi:hypothetical protein